MQGYRRSLPDISFHLRPFWLQSWMHMISIIGVETSKIYVFCVWIHSKNCDSSGETLSTIVLLHANLVEKFVRGGGVVSLQTIRHYAHGGLSGCGDQWKATLKRCTFQVSTATSGDVLDAGLLCSLFWNPYTHFSARQWWRIWQNEHERPAKEAQWHLWERGCNQSPCFYELRLTLFFDFLLALGFSSIGCSDAPDSSDEKNEESNVLGPRLVLDLKLLLRSAASGGCSLGSRTLFIFFNGCVQSCLETGLSGMAGSEAYCENSKYANKPWQALYFCAWCALS